MAQLVLTFGVVTAHKTVSPLPIDGVVLDGRAYNSCRLLDTIARFKPRALGNYLFFSLHPKQAAPRRRPSGHSCARESENSDGVTEGNRPLK